MYKKRIIHNKILLPIRGDSEYLTLILYSGSENKTESLIKYINRIRNF